MSSEGVARKKRIRAGHKASATRIVTQINGILSEDNPDLTKLLQLKLSIQEKLETIKSLDGELLDLVTEDDLTSEIEQADAYKEGIYAAIIRIDKCAMAVRAHTVTEASEMRRTPTPHEKVKLPKLILRPFNGDMTTWTTFWESFESSVHMNKELSDIDKFNYLNSLLTGTAKEAVSGLSLTSANYKEAVAILKKRFGNVERIKSRHMELLMNIEAVHSSRDLKALRRFHDFIESHVRSLKALDVDSATYGSWLSSALLNRLPADLQLVISRKLTGTNFELTPFLKQLEEEIDARERVNPKPLPVQQRKVADQHLSTATTLVSNVNPTPTSCCFCQQQHPSSMCTTVTQVEARRDILKKSGRCFCCLKRGHLGRECRSQVRCSNCNGRHHRSICTRGLTQQALRTTTTTTTSADSVTSTPRQPMQPKPNQSSQTALDPSAAAFPGTVPTSTAMYTCTDKSIFLQTAQTDVYNPLNPTMVMKVRVILDSGSQKSYISQVVKNTLNLERQNSQHLSIATFGAKKESKLYETVEVGMKMRHGVDHVFSVLVVPHICEPISPQPLQICLENCEHLSQLDLADSGGDSPLEVHILIGSDYYWTLATGEIKRGTSGPVAVETKLGWVLSGPTPSLNMETPVTSLVTHTLLSDIEPVVSNQHLSSQLRSFWELESLGITKEDEPVHARFKKNVAFRDGRYEVCLPWKEFHNPLPDNYALSVRRLEGLIRRLRNTPKLLGEYNATIQDQVKRGIVEVVPSLEKTQEGRLHYLPHHAVVKSDRETTKLRIVYDASARSGGPSLNDCLYTGPKFNQNIFDILVRFRSYRVALIADIEKAFLMIGIEEGDRDALRFLWIDSITEAQPKTIALRFARVVFGVSSSPFLLNATIRHHLEGFASTHPTLVSCLLRSLYVDDLVCGANNEEEAYDLFRSSKEILKRGSFNLRKFTTNSQRLQSMIDEVEGTSQTDNFAQQSNGAEETYASSTIGPRCPPRPGVLKILGVFWNVASDHLLFSFEEVAKLAAKTEPTKRNVVSVVSSLYDPLGLVTPVTIRFKIFMKELCETVADWDQLLTGDTLQKWQCLVTELQGGWTITIPRYLCYCRTVVEEVSYELHGFCDASLKAYAAVIYLAVRTSVGESLQFVTSKARVAPTQTQTIPRLELLSSLLLARLITTVSKGLSSQLTLGPHRCFTDSTVALYWIKGTSKEWKQFVQNRVIEIRRLVSPELWSHCCGQNNPADIPSRGLTAKDMATNELWWNGPTSLERNNPEELTMPAECAVEMMAKDRVSHNLLTGNPTPNVSLQQVIVCKNYSTLTRLLRVTAYVIRFLKMLKGRMRPNSSLLYQSLTLTPDEITDAERLWILEAQTQLTQERNFDEWKRQYNLFSDENGILRCGGRLGNSALLYNTKHPVLLSKQHHLAVLVVRQAHEKVFHNGVKDTLTEVRANYWIVKGRSLVRSIIHHCVLCKRFEGRSYHLPASPPLPSFRVNEAAPFSSTGVDFAGPLYVRTHGLIQSKKVWICLYTCCVTRAVSVDVVPDMSTETFIRSLKRFCARRGLPRLFISDNGKTFKAASRVIETIVADEAVQQFLSQLRVKWCFNLAKAPWWGGIFERLVRSTKRCLRKVIGQAKLSYDELLTAVTEIESIINSRPLSYVTPDDLEEPLTPSHLLMGRRVLSLPDDLSYQRDIQDGEFEVGPVELSRRVRHLNNALNLFWKRWRREYLIELREAHRFGKTGSKKAQISVNDLVVVHDENQPRGFWRLAKVENVIVGIDGEVRGATVRVSSRDGNVTVLQRPLSLLYPLEINCPAEPTTNRASVEVQEDAVSTESPQEEVIPAPRPRRAAASRAIDRVRRWMAGADGD